MQNNPFSYRHFTVYMHTMELVRLGDISVEAYNRLMELFKSNLAVMLPYIEVSDGLGLEYRLADSGVMVCQTPVAVVAAEQQTNSSKLLLNMLIMILSLGQAIGCKD